MSFRVLSVLPGVLFFSLLCSLVWGGLATGSASAQRLLAHDTLSMDTPSAVSCGFCGDEVIGVVFRELPGTGGIRATDFPLGLLNVQVALADAMTDGTTCNTDTVGGAVTAAVEVWAGPTPPTTLPAATVIFGMPWSAEETLVWGSDAVPLTLSTPTTDGGVMFNLQFNAYEPVDDMGMPLSVIVPDGNSYLRVAVLLPGGGGNNSVCATPLEVPGGFPLRDNDGRLADQRSYIYAGGVGWLWNEDARLNGDWAIRVSVDPMAAPRDAGMRDAGARDTGSTDAAGADGSLDGGTVTPPAGGCACRASGRACRTGGGGAPSAWWPLLLCAAFGFRRVSARRRG